MARTRSTFRLDEDVRGYLEDASESYDGVNMTSALHIITRHCMKEGVLDDLLRQESEETSTENYEDTSQDQASAEDSPEVDNESATLDREDESDGGVSFSDMARDAPKEGAEQDDGTRRPDEGNGDSGESPGEDSDGKPRSAAASVRERFRS